jgi:hypothetical protein
MIFIAHANFLWESAGVKFAAGYPKNKTNSGSRRSSIINQLYAVRHNVLDEKLKTKKQTLETSF